MVTVPRFEIDGTPRSLLGRPQTANSLERNPARGERRVSAFEPLIIFI